MTNPSGKLHHSSNRLSGWDTVSAFSCSESIVVAGLTGWLACTATVFASLKLPPRSKHLGENVFGTYRVGFCASCHCSLSYSIFVHHALD
jgi:hypothetical protein